MSLMVRVKFTGSDQTFEYAVPTALIVPGATHAVVPRGAHSVAPAGKGCSMVVTKIMETTQPSEQEYEGELVSVIALFTEEPWREELKRAKRRKQVVETVKRRLADMSILAQVKALGLDDDPEMAELVAELKKLTS